VDVVEGTNSQLAEHGQRRPGQAEQSLFAGVRRSPDSIKETLDSLSASVRQLSKVL